MAYTDVVRKLEWFKRKRIGTSCIYRYETDLTKRKIKIENNMFLWKIAVSLKNALVPQFRTKNIETILHMSEQAESIRASTIVFTSPSDVVVVMLYSTASCSPRIRPWVQVTNFVMDIVKPYHGLLADLVLPRYEVSTTRGRCQSSSGSWQRWKTKLIFDLGRRTFMNLRKPQIFAFFNCPLRVPTFAKWYQITKRVADRLLEMRESEHAGDFSTII